MARIVTSATGRLIKFRFKSISKLPKHLAQKLALAPVAPRLYRPEILSDGVIIADLIDIVQLWRKRLSELQKLGWDRTQRGGWLRLANCPPPFTYTWEESRTCRNAHVCPFCWSRLVTRATYDRLVWAMFGHDHAYTVDAKTGKSVPAVSQRWDVIDAVSRTFLKELASPELLLFELSKGLGSVHQFFRNHALGAYALSTVEPEPSGGWWVVRRGLVVVRPDLSVALPEPTELLSYRRLSGPATHEDLARIVGRVCQYPAGLLTADAAEALKIIKARQGHRGPGKPQPPKLAMCYGALRNNRARKLGSQGARQGSERN